jgi:hypothetical protein
MSVVTPEQWRAACANRPLRESARRFHISPAYLCQLIHGQRRASVELSLRFAAATNDLSLQQRILAGCLPGAHTSAAEGVLDTTRGVA